MSELERALVGLGRELDVPAAPDVATALRGRLEPRPQAPVPRMTRRWVLVLAVCAVAALLATLAIPDARSALLRILHLGGAQIELVDELPPVPAEPIELDILLGDRTTLELARRDAGFELRELDEAPDRVSIGDHGTVWFLYGSLRNVRLLVAQTPRFGIDQDFILKKLVAAGTTVEEIEVDGAPAFLISGEPHAVMLVDETGEFVEETARLARNVLLWEDDGVAYRLEGEFDREQALAIAKSLR